MGYVAEISYAREGCGLLDKPAWVNFEKAETARKQRSQPSKAPCLHAVFGAGQVRSYCIRSKQT